MNVINFQVISINIVLGRNEYLHKSILDYSCANLRGLQVYDTEVG